MTGKILNYKCDNSIRERTSTNLEIPTEDARVPETPTGQRSEIPKHIYVNPNYGVKRHLIHVNPHINPKSTIASGSKVNSASTSIYINPKLPLSVNSKTDPKPSIHVNPKLNLKPLIANSKSDQKLSIHVNPKLNPKSLIASPKMVPKSIHVNPKLNLKPLIIKVNQKSTVYEIPKLNPKPLIASPKMVPKSIHVNPKLNLKPMITTDLKVSPKSAVYEIPKLNPKPLIANPKLVPKSIHVNPKLNLKPLITNLKVSPKSSVYEIPKLNPKLLTLPNSEVNTKTSIYVNPKIVRDMNIVKNLQEKQISVDTSSARKVQPNSSQEYVQKSVHVNPKLLKTIASAQPTKSLPSETKTSEQINYNVYSKSNVKNTGSSKFVNSNFSVVSRRKLIRVKRNFKTTVTVSPNKSRQFGNKMLKRSQIGGNNLSTPARILQMNRLKFVKNKIKGNAYKLDRIAVSKVKNRTSGETKVSGNFKKLVSIEGIRYNSSKNQLIRRNSTSPTKKKRIISNKTQDQFFIASNGKALRRIDATRKGHTPVISSRYLSVLNRNISIRKTSPASLKQIVKSNISNKVKQRSLQLLRNKMRKNNQPCLFFRKFGYCANQAKGTCNKVHDKKQIALCKNFLQGKCLAENCKLSHDVGPEKMPTCKYFLEGCCSRDECPYLHVKVSEKTPICRQFLQGYCAKGNECKERHIFTCPEFEKEGKCSKGKQCPYPHKSKASKTPRTLQVNKVSTPLIASSSSDLTCTVMESRKRYYDSLNEDLEEKRKRILRKLKIAKTALNPGNEGANNESAIEETEESDEEDTTVFVPRKRPPVGILPSYIPIN